MSELYVNFTDILYCKLTDIMEKLDNHIFKAITQLRSTKKQPNESAIMTHLSEELEELNIDKKRLTERSKYIKYMQTKEISGQVKKEIELKVQRNPQKRHSK